MTIFNLTLEQAPCTQCSTLHTGDYAVCEGCIQTAQTQLEGALGGRVDSAHIARMFDMGGAGLAPQGCHVGRPVIKIHWEKL